MLAKETLKKVLDAALSTGGDFAEIFVEDRLEKTLSYDYVESKSRAIYITNGGQYYGVGIRICKDFKSIYAYTTDDTLESLLSIAKKAAVALNKFEASQSLNFNLIETIPTNVHPILKVSHDLDLHYKISKLHKAYKAAQEYSSEIVSAMVKLGESDQKVQIANSNGLLVCDRRIQTEITVYSTAENGSDKQYGSNSIRSSAGFELIENSDLTQLGRHASENAITLLHADYCKAGKMPVVIASGMGTIFHEACGHPLEADSIAKGNSVFCGKLGEKIANEKITLIDDGTIPNAWGSTNIDDEGQPTQRNVLIEKGVLKSYLIDTWNAKQMNMASTGSGRRGSYHYAPTSRMTNTYVMAGEDEDDEIIKSVEHGLYVKNIRGGSVNSLTGAFNFAVSLGYMIRDGEISESVKGASLIGMASKVLMDVDMVGKNLVFANRICSSISGSIPVTVGQPIIRIKELTVGGR
ncbi:MAG: peptidase C69 [Candidatus Epulonipiscioides saccharophilum]|nr:MAG: peptidase C69 [Epulopiscium sp. AS2M-Bin001]